MPYDPKFRYVGQPPGGGWGSVAFALLFVAGLIIAAVLGLLK